MPSRNVPFINGEYYHIYNRGVAKVPVFLTDSNYSRFLNTLLYYQIADPKVRFSFFDPTKNELLGNTKIVDIICYCLMPNHFHFILKQTRDNGITECISRLSNSYTKYFNVRYERVGSLFQGEFKSIHIESDEQLWHLSRYIHLNPLIGAKTRSLDIYRWSSYPEFIGKPVRRLCDKSIVLENFKSHEKYQDFVLDQIDYANKLDLIKHQLIDNE